MRNVLQAYLLAIASHSNSSVIRINKKQSIKRRATTGNVLNISVTMKLNRKQILDVLVVVVIWLLAAALVFVLIEKLKIIF